jgi:hypothetical protein
MPTIVKGTLTKEEDQSRQERLKGKGFEQPCYLMQPQCTKPKKIKNK